MTQAPLPKPQAGMIGDLRASLYDLFGYLLPGFVGMVALVLLLQHLGEPGAPAAFAWVNELFAIPFLVMSYLVGHVAQGMGNVLLSSSPESLAFGPKGLPVALRDRAVKLLSERVGVDIAALPPEEQFALLDEARAWSPSPNEREVYVYREGFYRGMVVASSALAIALASHLKRSTLCAASTDGTFCVSRGAVTAIVLLSVLAVAVFVQRMRRFGRYRVQRGLYLFLVAAAGPAPTKGK